MNIIVASMYGFSASYANGALKSGGVQSQLFLKVWGSLPPWFRRPC